MLVITITEEEMTKRGAYLAKVLELKRDRAHKDRYQTLWGSKSDLGLFLTVNRIMEFGEDE